MSATLVRYGSVPQVAKFPYYLAEPLDRGAEVIVRTSRGVELGTLLQAVEGSPPNVAAELAEQKILRTATAEDRQRRAELRQQCEAEFSVWLNRIHGWNLNLELIDLERMLDGEKLVLYVLNDRGPDCTKLALYAAAAGLGVLEVQPVDAGGLVEVTPRGGCGSGAGGCGSGGCGH